MSKMADDRHDRGMKVRREVLGDAHVDRALAAATEFTRPWQEFLTSLAWGDIWTRPGLDRRTRSCITVAMLVALGKTEELKLHVRGALNNGVSEDELFEVLLQSAVYCGVPAANEAFRIASDIIGFGSRSDA
jgi:4-carboxymuconolactone decarboxylase